MTPEELASIIQAKVEGGVPTIIGDISTYNPLERVCIPNPMKICEHPDTQMGFAINAEIDPEYYKHLSYWFGSINLNLEFFISVFKPTIMWNLSAGDVASAYYPESDIILIKPPRTYPDMETYYRVLFHEFVRWTGHKDRLNRVGTYADRNNEDELDEYLVEMILPFGVEARLSAKKEDLFGREISMDEAIHMSLDTLIQADPHHRLIEFTPDPPQHILDWHENIVKRSGKEIARIIDYMNTQCGYWVKENSI